MKAHLYKSRDRVHLNRETLKRAPKIRSGRPPRAQTRSQNAPPETPEATKILQRPAKDFSGVLPGPSGTPPGRPRNFPEDSQGPAWKLKDGPRISWGRPRHLPVPPQEAQGIPRP